MGLLDGVLGNASEINPSEAAAECATLLMPGEGVEKAYRIIRDSLLFTDRRLILINVQGMTGAKISYQSIPYRSIIRFSVETAGSFDLDAEMKIYLSGGGVVGQRFTRKLNIYEVQKVLASYVLR